MKTLSRTIGCVAIVACVRFTSAASGASAQANTPRDFLLTPGKAGSFQIGDPVDDVYQRVGRENVSLVDLFKEGLFTPAIQIRLPGSDGPALVADIREWPCGNHAIYGLSVRDRRFRTPEGLGVGSSVFDLRLAYSVQASHAEGQSVIVNALKMSFAVDGNSENDRSRVTAVWLWPDPVAVRLRRCPEKR
jgi:hypothetical protein